MAAGFEKDAAAVKAEFEHKFPDAAAALVGSFYDRARDDGGSAEGALWQGVGYTAGKNGNPGRLSRATGPCQFCDNSKWKFPQGCPYGKPEEQQYEVGFLEKGRSNTLKQS